MSEHQHGPVEFLDKRERKRGLRPRDAAALIVAVWLVAVVIFGLLEHWIEPEKFPTIWWGMWWALETVTTVGYGDVVPATTAGKAVGSLLLLGGLSFLSVVTALITSGFISRRQRSERREVDEELLRQVQALREEVRALQGQPAQPGDGG
jgi:hypothetical protein